MNCSEVEPFLDQFVRPPVDGVPDNVAMREHVAGCSNCQQHLRTLGNWDQKLVRAMNDVIVPSGLRERLTGKLSETVEQALSRPTLEEGRARIWSLTARNLVAACLTVLAIWLTWNIARAPLLSAPDVATLLAHSTDNLPMSKDPFQRLPRQWASLRGRLFMDYEKQLDLADRHLTITIIPLEVRSKRGPSIEGSLFVIPKSRWTPTPESHVSRAPVQYAPPHVWVAWTESDVVYVLALNGQAPVLEQIQRQLDGNHAVL